jgi:hypothetical protein
VIAKNPKNGIQSNVEVVSSERIIGYNTINGILEKNKMLDDSEYYNVTLNLVVRKGSGFQQVVEVDEAKPEETKV